MPEYKIRRANKVENSLKSLPLVFAGEVRI